MGDNRRVVGSVYEHSEVGLERGLPKAVAAPRVLFGVRMVQLLDGVKQELTAGSALLVCYHSFWDQKQMVHLPLPCAVHG